MDIIEKVDEQKNEKQEILTQIKNEKCNEVIFVK